MPPVPLIVIGAAFVAMTFAPEDTATPSLKPAVPLPPVPVNWIGPLADVTSTLAPLSSMPWLPPAPLPPVPIRVIPPVPVELMVAAVTIRMPRCNPVLASSPPWALTAILPLPEDFRLALVSCTPEKLPTAVPAMLASTIRLPFTVSKLDPAAIATFLLTFTVMVPVPLVMRLAVVATFTMSVPGVTLSFCRSRSRLAFEAKVMSPFKLTVSSPVPPLIVRLGNALVKAPTLMTSAPAAASTTMLVKPASVMLPESPVVLSAPFTLKVRPVASNLMLPATGSEMASVSPLPLTSVTVITPLLVTTV